MAFTSLLAASTLLVASVVADLPSCPSNSPVSCSTNNIQNTCCTETQGQVVSVQLWDTNPATGPSDHWTIHGLWPDACDGSYSQFCDPSRETYNISCIISSYGDNDLLNDMNTYWLDQKGDNENFWEHEWNKHGTCYSTLNPSCFPNYTQQEEVVAFFQQAVNQFKAIDTYSILSNAGITPTSDQTYAQSDIINALSSATNGYAPVLSCNKGALYQVAYTFNVQGSVADGTFIPAAPVGESGNCPSQISYLPKQLDTEAQATSGYC